MIDDTTEAETETDAEPDAATETAAAKTKRAAAAAKRKKIPQELAPRLGYTREQRMVWAERRLGKYTTLQLATAMSRVFGIADRTARDDIKLIADRARSEDKVEQEYRLAAARREWGRRARRFEALGKLTDSNYAYDKVCRINGVYAPKKIELSGTISIGAQITSLVGVLDAKGLAALEIVQEQIAAARERGLLPSHAATGLPEASDALTPAHDVRVIDVDAIDAATDDDDDRDRDDDDRDDRDEDGES